MRDEREVWQEVQELQEKLHEVVTKKGIKSPEAIRVIQEIRNKMDEFKRLR